MRRDDESVSADEPRTVRARVRGTNNRTKRQRKVANCCEWLQGAGSEKVMHRYRFLTPYRFSIEDATIGAHPQAGTTSVLGASCSYHRPTGFCCSRWASTIHSH